MKAIVFKTTGDPSVLELVDVPIPALKSPYDILVRIKGCALNPVDTKIRRGSFAADPILGFDGAGVVAESAEQALFRPGEEVYFSGALGRAGTNAQYTVVDSRIAARRPFPTSGTVSGVGNDGDGLDWGWAEVAALPLVGLTAWEMFEDHFHLVPFGAPAREETLLIVNGAGGVGSVATQLARKVFGIQKVVVTASRPDTEAWAKRNGATHVVNHREPLGAQLEALGLVPSLAFICHDTPKYLKQLCGVMRSHGKIGSIVETEEPLGFESMDAFTRALSFHWEFMLSKPMMDYDVESQGGILGQLSEAVEKGLVKSFVGSKVSLSVGSLREMHTFQESGKAIGKVAFEVKDNIE